MTGKLFTFALLMGFINVSAQAGELIRFQNGNLNPLTQAVHETAQQQQKTQADWIIQFKKPVTFQEQKRLQQTGVLILGYLPDDALVVRSSGFELQRIRHENSNINAIVLYPAEMKLAQEIKGLSIFNQDEEDVYLIKTFLESDSGIVERQIEKQDLGLVLYNSGKQLLVSMKASQILSVLSLRGVEHLQKPAQMQKMDIDFGMNSIEATPGDYSDLTGYESGTQIMNMKAAWDLGYHGEGQMASMSDTGLDTGNKDTIHPDFKGALSDGQIFGLYSKSWGDPMGHGTHVSGSIVGRGTSSGGKLRGGAFAAQYVAQSMWSPMMSGLMVPTKLSDMFGKAYQAGARVHSNSWGAANNFGAYDNYANQVDDFTFQNQEMLIVFAAGNSGVDKDKDGRIDPGSMSSPGTAKNALTVGASENLVLNGGLQKSVSDFRQAKDSWPAEPIWSSKISDNPQGLAMFSSRGPTNDQRTKPEIVAPGTNILSTRSQDPKAELLWGAYNKDYVWSGGTSMATPLVAGAATVTRQILQQKYKIANPSAALVKAALMNTAFDLYPGQYGEVGAQHGQEIITHRPNSDEGYGRVDMAQMTGRDLFLIDENVGLAQGETKSYDIEVLASEKVIINMVYTDAPGSVNAAQALVNDLDLSLLNADGSIVANPQDRINNNEAIEMTLAPGKYKIVVTGTKIPQGKSGKQSFAVVKSSY